MLHIVHVLLDWFHWVVCAVKMFHVFQFLGSRVKRSESIKWPSGVRPTVRPSVPNLNMDNISDTNCSRVTKLGPKVVCGKTFPSIQFRMTLSQGQGHRVTLKILKNGLFLISRTLITVESWNLYHIVANVKAFTWTYGMMTLTLVQGHFMTLNTLKNALLLISRTLFAV